MRRRNTRMNKMPNPPSPGHAVVQGVVRIIQKAPIDWESRDTPTESKYQAERDALDYMDNGDTDREAVIVERKDSYTGKIYYQTYHI